MQRDSRAFTTRKGPTLARHGPQRQDMSSHGESLQNVHLPIDMQHGDLSLSRLLPRRSVVQGTAVTRLGVRWQ